MAGGPPGGRPGPRRRRRATFPARGLGGATWRRPGADRGVAARVLVIACGALARELMAIVDHNRFDHLAITCLPAELHGRPSDIPGRVAAALADADGRFERVFVAYADCGTGGGLDAVLAPLGVERLPGAHCYEFFATGREFAVLAEEEPGTFYLTDFLARHFESLVLRGLGLDQHPELLPDYFGNYRRVVYLAQRDDPELIARARAAAAALRLDFVHRPTGFGDLAASIVALGVAGAP